MYSLDKRVSSSILLTDFLSKNASREADYCFNLPHRLPSNYLGDYSSLPHNYKNVNCLHVTGDITRGFIYALLFVCGFITASTSVNRHIWLLASLQNAI